MEPVRIKLYGLFTVTKQRYLKQQIVSVVLVLGLLVVWYAAPRPDAPVMRGGFVEPTAEPLAHRPLELPPGIQRLLVIFHAIPWVVGALLFLIVLESVIVLRAFARKEAEQLAATPPAPPSTEQPSETVAPVEAPSVNDNAHG